MNVMQPLLDLASTSSVECVPCSMQAGGVEVSEPSKWSGVLGMEGQMTGDGRYIEANALYWEDLPLPIRYVSSDVGAHDGAQVVGKITNIWRGEGGQIMGEGDFDTNSGHGKEALRQVKEGLTTGVSMDLDDVSFEVRMSSELVNLLESESLAADEEAEADEDGRVKVAAVKSDDEVRITTSGRIRAATIVAIPAFSQAKIALAASAQSFGSNPSQARAPKGSAKGGQWIDTPGGIAANAEAFSNNGPWNGPGKSNASNLNDMGFAGGGWFEGGGANVGRAYTGKDGRPRYTYLVQEDFSDSDRKWYVLDGPVSKWGDLDESDPSLISTETMDLPGAIGKVKELTKDTTPIDANSLSANKLTTFATEEQITMAVSDDPFPFEMTLALQALKATDKTEFGSDDYMALATKARDLFQVAVDKGLDQASEFVDALDAFLAVDWSMWQPSDEEQPDLTEPGLDEPLLASASVNFPPRAWFANPGLTEATPLTVTDDGRIFGHLAVWDTCHIGHSHSGCVKPPRSKAGYAYFRVGSVMTDDGSEVATGRITLETRHALGSLNATQTLAHYEDTGRAVADVAAGEDRFGIWIAGSVRPSATDDQIRALRGSPLSGDWRRIAGNLELVAALAVNVPGFPIPRPNGMVASGQVQSLVASGMMPPRKVVPPGSPGALSDDDLRYLKSLAARERETARRHAEQMRTRVTIADLEMRRKSFEMVGGK